RRIAISAKRAYWPPAWPALLSNLSSTMARPTGWRLLEPLKMTSSRASPRSCRALDSPVTQRTASMTLDLPQPLGPTMPVRLASSTIVVGSTNDLKPASLIEVSRMKSRYGANPRSLLDLHQPCGAGQKLVSHSGSLVVHPP